MFIRNGLIKVKTPTCTLVGQHSVCYRLTYASWCWWDPPSLLFFFFYAVWRCNSCLMTPHSQSAVSANRFLPAVYFTLLPPTPNNMPLKQQCHHHQKQQAQTPMCSLALRAAALHACCNVIQMTKRSKQPPFEGVYL